MVESNQKFENDALLIYIEDGIVHVVYKETKKLQVDVVKLAIAKRLELAGPNVTLPLLADFRKPTGGTKEAIEYFSHESSYQGLSVGAIIVDNVPTMIGINFYMKFSKPPLPSKVFVNRDKALEWLKRHKSVSLN